MWLILGFNTTILFMLCPKRLLLIIILAILGVFLSPSVLAAAITVTPEPTSKIEQPVSISTPSANFQTVATANVLYNRLSVASSRLELIFNRITTRADKIYATFARGKTDVKARQLNSQYTSLETQIDKLKKESSKTQELYRAFLIEPDNTNYQAFRKQVVTIDTLLKQVLTTEKTVLTTMENLGGVSASESVTPKVTVKVVSPTIKQ